MNDIRRTILWVIFGFSMVLLWDKWQVYNGNRGVFTPAPVVATAPASDAPAAVSGVPGTTGTSSASSVPGVPSGNAASGAAQISTPANTQAPLPARERVEVSTDVLKLASMRKAALWCMANWSR